MILANQKYRTLKFYFQALFFTALLFILGGAHVNALIPVGRPTLTNMAIVTASSCQDANGTLVNNKSTAGTGCVTNVPDPVTSKGAPPDLVKNYLNPFIKLLSVLVGLAVIIGIIYGGIEYSTSAGDPQKAAAGKKRIRNAILALIVYALTMSFLNFIIPGGIQVISI